MAAWVLRQQRLDCYLIRALFVFVLTGFLISQGQEISTSDCDKGYIRHNSSCFKVYETRTWHRLAKLVCTYDDAQLASISSKETLDFLASIVRSVDMNNFWIGLHVHNTRLIWNDNSDAQNQSWVTPLNSTDSLERCYYFDGQAVIPTRLCLMHIGFICERKAVVEEESNTCPEHMIYAQHIHMCLWVIDSPVPKDKAEDSCREQGGSMLDFDGLSVSGFHRNTGFWKPDVAYWTNITWNGETPVWKGAHLEEKDFNISILGTIRGDGNCVVMHLDFSDLFPIGLFREKCNSSANVICSALPRVTPSRLTLEGNTQTSPIPTELYSTSIWSSKTCPHGYNWKEDKRTGYCYWETSYETPRLSWDVARKYCQTYGGDLASFHDLEEEKIGLSFQYGATSHPYWIGLKFEPEFRDYRWTDGSEQDYTNWALGQPDDIGLRVRCAEMDAMRKSWISSYCGKLNWFICKAPKQENPTLPVPPTPEPLESCSGDLVNFLHNDDDAYHFRGSCYKVYTAVFDWHRAHSYCQNKNGNLVSIHDEPEVDFLLRLLYESSQQGNRVWIGLNSLGIDDQLKWSDGTPLDFVHWNKREPNNYLKQEKCCNMYIKDGLWNDENCSSGMGFVCEWKNVTDSRSNPSATTPSPAPGNCKKDWHPFQDSCFFLVGARKTEWANHSSAADQCRALGGALTSIGSAKEQAFLTFLMQGMKADMWIGLHDSLRSGSYFWVDNAPITYTNWALGYPFPFTLMDCVYLNYENEESGIWKNALCSKELPFICKARKDPSITSPSVPKSTRCISHEGWLKMGLSCFKFFNESKTWVEAVDTCYRDYSAKLVSISDFRINAAVRYMTMDHNASIWIGLLTKKGHQFDWMNGQPMRVSHWDSNEPALHGKEDQCFSSSDGYWKISDCEQEMPFICHIDLEEPPTEDMEHRNCPTNTWDSIEGDKQYCYHIENSLGGFDAHYKCFIQGGRLVSIHSEGQISRLKKYVERAVPKYPFFIGLIRNKKGGFAWTDGSPVDYENWEIGEPQSASHIGCVEMKMGTLTWRVVSCSSKKNALCAIKTVRSEFSSTTTRPTDTDKVIIEFNSTSGKPSGQIAHSEEEVYTGLSGGILAAIIVSLLVLTIASIVAYLYYKPWNRKHFRLRSPQITSFENALYDADSSLELKEEKDSDLFHH